MSTPDRVRRSRGGEYVICKADSSPILEFPNGIAIQTVYAGHRYTKAEAVVKQHPELFMPVEPQASLGR